jgi:sugar phosphate isomerase/epimerase
VFARETRPDVILQFDLGNALHGGGDPLPLLRKYADRAVTIHLKDHDPNNDKALLGEGTLNWDEVFRLCEGSGKTEWYIVEQESYAYPPMECVRRCRENLRKMGR